ncbi:MAG: hypothetical protein B7Z67_13655 [Acidiphilium sp. 21-60-14]|nr:MAG: hypothetical protein B7Z67_13655 [Acidiphilium sp. 21-60-14]
MKQPAIYILTNRCNGTLYTGVTSNLPGRVWQHHNGKTSIMKSCNISSAIAP